MLKQMLSDDRNEAVREAVTKSLALVVAFIENVDKYEQVGRTYIIQNVVLSPLNQHYISLVISMIYKQSGPKNLKERKKRGVEVAHGFPQSVVEEKKCWLNVENYSNRSNKVFKR